MLDRRWCWCAGGSCATKRMLPKECGCVPARIIFDSNLLYQIITMLPITGVTGITTDRYVIHLADQCMKNGQVMVFINHRGLGLNQCWCLQTLIPTVIARWTRYKNPACILRHFLVRCPMRHQVGPRKISWILSHWRWSFHGFVLIIHSKSRIWFCTLGALMLTKYLGEAGENTPFIGAWFGKYIFFV